MDWFDDLRALKLTRNSSWRTALAALPAGLEGYWKHSAPQEYKGIPTDAFFFVRAAEGLMNFFDVVTGSSKPCALPSEAADSVWHAWLRWDPPGWNASASSILAPPCRMWSGPRWGPTHCSTASCAAAGSKEPRSVP